MEKSLEEIKMSRESKNGILDNIPIADALFRASLRRGVVPYVPHFMEAISKTPFIIRDVMTPSLTITGNYKGRGGENQADVLYIHTENYLSNPRNILAASRDPFRGALRFPQIEFDSLIDRTDNRKVFRVGLQKITRSRKKMIKSDLSVFSGAYCVKTGPDNLEEDVQALPFFGSEENLQIFLKKIGNNSFESCFIGTRADFPLGRFLCMNVGRQYSITNSENFAQPGRVYMIRRSGDLGLAER